MERERGMSGGGRRGSYEISAFGIMEMMERRMSREEEASAGS